MAPLNCESNLHNISSSQSYCTSYTLSKIQNNDIILITWAPHGTFVVPLGSLVGIPRPPGPQAYRRSSGDILRHPTAIVSTVGSSSGAVSDHIRKGQDSKRKIKATVRRDVNCYKPLFYINFQFLMIVESIFVFLFRFFFTQLKRKIEEKDESSVPQEPAWATNRYW